MSATQPPPVVPDVVVQTIKASASIAGCYLFASLYPEIRQVRINRATGTMLLLPLLSMFGNCVLWTLYGFLIQAYFPMVATNVVGLGFSSFYMAVYYQFTPDRRRVRRQLLATFLALFVVSMYPVFSYEPRKVVQQHIGYLAITVCAVMFGSPLVVVKQVIVTKKTDLLPFGMIVAGFINSSLWLTYGLCIQDAIVTLPNLLNLCLGAVQLVLFCVFPRGKGYDKVTATTSPDNDVVEVKVSNGNEL
ncbi:hypothetical protein Poli38472_013109 [Pythium oligandrum]|uniref:Sugar transporter SWEET1 n=1 Tax=Pythium oligandrum TaxID=41045 RepID=A0A8K1C2F8_PYTOL|nr:hypothetical protein Poli38472_013109 [Pythium oligandrum]|eukprot:TMW55218.1 hypothetical protein Poli38472_013109 [Pythium oligandrum]